MRNYKIVKISMISILSFILLFPSIDKLNQTYQSSMWTYDTWRKHSVLLNDTQFVFGGEINELKEWTRIHLGFPIKAITLDVQWNEMIIQGRIEWTYLIPWICISLVSFIILFIWKQFIIKR